MTPPDQYVVAIVDLVNARVAGRYGSYYVSPPQPRAKALALARTWLGDTFDRNRTAWSIGIPHGRRIVTLSPDAQVVSSLSNDAAVLTTVVRVRPRSVA